MSDLVALVRAHHMRAVFVYCIIRLFKCIYLFFFCISNISRTTGRYTIRTSKSTTVETFGKPKKKDAKDSIFGQIQLYDEVSEYY